MQGEENMFHLQCVYGVNDEDVLEVCFFFGIMVLDYGLDIWFYPIF